MKTNKNGAIRTLRAEIQKTQGEFSAIIGVSKEAVVSWENGRNRLSDSAARRIYRVTGAMVCDLLKGKRNVRFFNGDKYTLRHFKIWNHHYKENAEVADRMAQRHMQELRLLFLTAAKPRSKVRGRLHAFQEAFIRWMAQAVAEFKLDADHAAVLKENPIDRNHHTIPTWQVWTPNPEEYQPKSAFEFMVKAFEKESGQG